MNWRPAAFSLLAVVFVGGAGGALAEFVDPAIPTLEPAKVSVAPSAPALMEPAIVSAPKPAEISVPPAIALMEPPTATSRQPTKLAAPLPTARPIPRQPVVRAPSPVNVVRRDVAARSPAAHCSLFDCIVVVGIGF